MLCGVRAQRLPSGLFLPEERDAQFKNAPAIYGLQRSVNFSHNYRDSIGND